MNTTAAQCCTKCGASKPLGEFWVRKDRGTRYRQCRSCMNERKWFASNPERSKELRRNWELRDPEHTRKVWRDSRRRKARNPAHRVHSRISNQIWHVLRGKKNCRSAFSLVGYSAAELASHLERQFTPGMTWANVGEWHVDHIIPLSSFSISGPDDPELRRAWALSNLRPLWAVDNILKRDKLQFLI